MALKINKNLVNVYNHLLRMYDGVQIGSESELGLIRELLGRNYDLSIIDSCTEFYVRIDRQIWDRNVNSIIVNYYEFSNNIVGDKIEGLTASYTHRANPSINLLNQSYNYIKTLLEFEGAIDC